MALPSKQESTAHQTAREALEALKLTIRTEFVPWSKSRSFKPGPVRALDRNLNWKVTVLVDGRDVVTADYSAGVAHCPAYTSYKMAGQRFDSVDGAEALRLECETGRLAHLTGSVGALRGKTIEPDPVDVLYCLRSDGDAIDHPTYESWAGDLGYDLDSRKGEATYRECLRIGLALRAALGEAGLKTLADAYQDY